MVKLKKCYMMVLVAVICMLFVVFIQKASQPVIVKQDTSIDQILNNQRDRLRRELSDYATILPNNKTLHNFTQPIRTVVFTTWRSGSSFFGDVLNSMPGNFYHYEPLWDYGIVQFSGPPNADEAISRMKTLLNCNYTNLQRYLDFGKVCTDLFTQNTRLWSQCEAYPEHCWEPYFLNKFCKLFPFQVMKTVRMRLKLAESLLEDETLNVKVILLVRDPRGTMQSRRHCNWCRRGPECEQSSYLCAGLVADYGAAVRFHKLYPSRFRVIRYEDFSLNPYQMTKDIFSFIGVPLHPKVTSFLDSHTKLNIGNQYSTFRDSKNTPFHWKTDLNYTEVQQIENDCSTAMKLWGYVKANSSNLKDIFPLTSFDIQ